MTYCRRLLAFITACMLASGAAADDLHVSPVKGNRKIAVTNYYNNGGVLLKALEYRDVDGSLRILAFGGNDNGSTVDGKSHVSLHAYGLLSDGDRYVTKWEIKDFNGSYLCGLKMLMPLVNVIDAGDGQPLAAVPYWNYCDGLDPTVVKLILVYRDQKYVIRGSLPNQRGDVLTRAPSANFKELPVAVRRTARAYWAKVEAAAKKAADWADPNPSS